MGIADVRDAFVDAAKGALSCADARHRYLPDGNNSQILEFAGLWADGTPYAVTSEPIDPKASLQAAAQQLAGKLIAGRTRA